MYDYEIELISLSNFVDWFAPNRDARRNLDACICNLRKAVDDMLRLDTSNQEARELIALLLSAVQGKKTEVDNWLIKKAMDYLAKPCLKN